jgi:predicted ATPase
MQISAISIKNFRAIEDIQIDLSSRCNVVVGPNAIGKTTFVDAIRLVKGLIAPRTQNESNQTLFGLGAMSPHTPGEFDVTSLAGDADRKIEIECSVIFSLEELSILERPESLVAMATQSLISGMGRQFAPQTDLIGLLSSPQGRQRHDELMKGLSNAVSDLRSTMQPVTFGIHIDPSTGQATNPNENGGAFIAFLDRRLPPGKTLFSYFPADRAIPAQEQPVQIGPGDVGLLLESHNSQPQLKYSRLKNTIFNAVVSGRDLEQKEQFKAIFSKILRGKSLADVGVSERGLLRIEIQDDERMKSFSIDGMSSGEKGLILTCLLIAQTMEKGGILLLDEPELHLNPAVCSDLLNFLVDEYAKPRDLQLIICTHSSEILGAAFDRPDCELYHLVSGNVLAPVRKQDLEEVSAALKRLGSSQSEGLLYRGTVFVEGDDDNEILYKGFRELTQRYVIRPLGGRKNVEDEIEFLQKQERSSRIPLMTYFIFDNDGNPTKFKSSANVRVLQWDRNCLENYLLDFDILTDLVKDSASAKTPITNKAQLKFELKNLAMKQVADRAFFVAFNAIGSIVIKPREIQGKTFPELARLATVRFEEFVNKFPTTDMKAWEQTFVRSCEDNQKRISAEWDTSWANLCDGKRLIRDLHNAVGFREGLPSFKTRIITEMSIKKTELWQQIEQKFRALLGLDEA